MRSEAAGSMLANEMAHYVLPLPSMANYSKPEVLTQIEKIRSEIRQFGESRVGCEELSLLCSDVSAMQEKIGIEQIAEYEGWSFQYLPDGHVRFAPSAATLAKVVSNFSVGPSTQK